MKLSEKIIQNASPYWHKATDHQFVREMVNGTLDKAVFAEYLIQDYAFVDSFLDLVSYMIAYANTIEQKHRLSTFLSMITSDEDDYFIRSFKALGVDEKDYSPENVKRFPSIQGFDEAIKKAIASKKYEHCLAVLCCAESVYCEWATKYQDKKPEEFYFAEWLLLHNNKDFKEFVDWLKSELDALSDTPKVVQKEVEDIFVQVCQLEAAFFDESY